MERRNRAIHFSKEEQDKFHVKPVVDYDSAHATAISFREVAYQLYESALAIRCEENPRSQKVGCTLEYRAQELNRFAMGVEGLIPEVFARARAAEQQDTAD